MKDSGLAARLNDDDVSRSQRYARAVQSLDAAQKPGLGVPAYTRWVNRRGARRVAAAGFALGLTPNAITGISALLSALGIAVLVTLPSMPGVGPAVAVLLAAGYLFDSADGQLARLSGTSSRSGEWLDHVVDAFRTPAIHLAVVVAAWRHDVVFPALALIGLVFALVVSGQFMSQMLAEQLMAREGKPRRQGTNRQSWILLPTDPGTLCWSFVLWGFDAPFVIVYGLLAFVAAAHCAASLRRRFGDLNTSGPG